MSTAATILAMTKRRYSEPREVPLLGIKVRFRSLAEGEYGTFQAATLTAKTDGAYNAALKSAACRLITLTTVEADSDEPVFQATDAEFLKDVDYAVTRFLYTEALNHLGATEQDVETLVKNSESTGGGGSHSA